MAYGEQPAGSTASAFGLMPPQEDPMHHTGVPHTFRWSRPHRRALPDLLLLPAAYAVHAQRWPLLLFLHGAGERGRICSG